MSSASSSVTSAPVRLTGRVKWFNNKTGFGFISVVGGNEQFKDASEIFVHHSAVTVSQEQYRYLVEGEYVEFSVVDTESGVHKFQAGDVRGVKGGKLFCETRREHRVAQEGAAGVASGSRQQRPRDGQVSRGGSGGATRGGRVLRGRGGSAAVRGGGSSGSGSEWMLVRRGRPGERAPYRPRQENTQHHTEAQQQDTSVSESAAVTETTTTTTSTVTKDVPSTPKTTAARKPRQSKPTF